MFAKAAESADGFAAKRLTVLKAPLRRSQSQATGFAGGI
jgi:hypothetical protein